MVPSKHVVGTSGCTDHPLVTYCMSEYVSVHMYVYFYFIFTCILLLLMKREESERKKRLCARDISSTLSCRNCLYRALCDQLLVLEEESGVGGRGGSCRRMGGYTHVSLRQELVQHMREHPDQFEPFMETDDENLSFNEYCKLYKCIVVAIVSV